MNTFGKDLGELVLATLENRKPVVSDNKPELEYLCNLARNHHMKAMFLGGALHGWEWTEEEVNTLRGMVRGSLLFTCIEDNTQKEITKLFEENGVKFLMMKGSVLKHRYPRIELREMGDVDLLVYPECFQAAEDLLLSLGYVVVEDVKQHKVFKSPTNICVEVHHTMCDRTTDKKMYDYFCDYSRHRLKEGTKYTYELTDEDFYVYMMAHMARHFYVKGCGVRNLVDIYIFQKELGSRVNRKYIEKELNKIGILDFTKQMEKLADIWLGKAESSELYDNIFEYMLDGGSYGYDYNGFWNRFSDQKLCENNKGKLRLWYYFPPLTYMSEKYPQLEEHPSLLFFYWIKRFWDTLFAPKEMRKSKVERHEHVQEVDEDTIRKMSEIYKSMNFKFSSK